MRPDIVFKIYIFSSGHFGMVVHGVATGVIVHIMRAAVKAGRRGGGGSGSIRKARVVHAGRRAGQAGHVGTSGVVWAWVGPLIGVGPAFHVITVHWTVAGKVS